MNLSDNEGIERKTFVVTGGLGFVGSALCLALVRRGARQVRAFDLRLESPWSDDLRRQGVRCIRGDVRKKEEVYRALEGADCVFHLASYGKSGKEMLQYVRVHETNINGTCNVLDACLQHGVKRLVYLSAYDVVFGGEAIVNGDESLPYDHADPYGRSKSVAEQLVLKHSGRPFKGEKGTLYCCAIRPAAVYGPGEERHLPRIVTLAKLGVLFFKVGGKDVKSDWVYVDNVVSSLLLASTGLSDDAPGRQPVAAGQAYFISDGRPVNSYEFVGPLLRSLDYDLPKVSLSVWQAVMVGKLFWMFYCLLYPWLSWKWVPQPLILPAEVYKVGVTHYFSFLKATEELGYRPAVSPEEGMASTITYWKERKRRSLDGPTIYAWLFVVIGMTSLFCAGYLPDVGPVPFFRAVSLGYLRSMWMIRFVFVGGVVAHISESAYAWRLASKCDPANARGWFWQTFALGFLSLRLLLRRSKM